MVHVDGLNEPQVLGTVLTRELLFAVVLSSQLPEPKRELLKGVIVDFTLHNEGGWHSVELTVVVVPRVLIAVVVRPQTPDKARLSGYIFEALEMVVDKGMQGRLAHHFPVYLPLSVSFIEVHGTPHKVAVV